MASFDSGITSYVHATATVDVYFPVDAKGDADISCSQCPFFHNTSSKCGLNFQPCAYPNKYVGAYCPLQGEEGA